MEEIWKDVVHYEGLYEVSNTGKVRNKKSGRIMAQIKTNRGYLRVHLSKFGNLKNELVHRLVAMAFIENPNNYPQVNHKDENKANNNVDNLEWCSRQYNMSYGTQATNMQGKQRHVQSCRVNQYDIYGNFIATYRSINEAGKINNINSGAIYFAIQNGGTSGGYIWKKA